MKLLFLNLFLITSLFSSLIKTGSTSGLYLSHTCGNELSFLFPGLQFNVLYTSSYSTLDFYGFTVSSCPLGTVRDITITKTTYTTASCPIGQVPDSRGVCIANPITITSSKGYGTDGFIYNYSDGSVQHCVPSAGICSTKDKDGNTIPNLPINGIVYNDITDYKTNKFLKIGGTIVAVVGGAAIIAATGGAAALGLTSFGAANLGTAGIVSGLLGSSTAFLDTEYTVNTPVNDNLASTAVEGIKIDLSKMDLSKESSQVTKSVDASGLTVSKVVNPNGDTVTLKQTATDIVTKTVKSDGSSVEYTIPNTALAPNTTTDFSSVNNVPPVTVTKVETPAPVITNDGRIIKSPPKVSTTTSDFSPNNPTVWKSAYRNTGLTTSSTTYKKIPTTGQSTSTATGSTLDINGSVTGSTSTSTTSSTDFSAITGRLEQLINQGTKSNGLLDKLGKSTNNGLAESTQILKDIKGLLSATTTTGSVVDTVQTNANIDKKVKSVEKDLQTWSDKTTNLKSGYDNIVGQFKALKSTIETGFTNNLPTATVTTCPYTNNLTGAGINFPISIDVCSVIAPFYSVTYFIFYVLFFGSFLTTAFSLLVSTRSN